eukprot:scaffold223841_cov47-Prasinocladus_malaysianus.AAC.2
MAARAAFSAAASLSASSFPRRLERRAHRTSPSGGSKYLESTTLKFKTSKDGDTGVSVAAGGPQFC